MSVGHFRCLLNANLLERGCNAEEFFFLGDMYNLAPSCQRSDTTYKVTKTFAVSLLVKQILSSIAGTTVQLRIVMSACIIQLYTVQSRAPAAIYTYST